MNVTTVTTIRRIVVVSRSIMVRAEDRGEHEPVMKRVTTPSTDCRLAGSSRRCVGSPAVFSRLGPPADSLSSRSDGEASAVANSCMSLISSAARVIIVSRMNDGTMLSSGGVCEELRRSLHERTLERTVRASCVASPCCWFVNSDETGTSEAKADVGAVVGTVDD